MQGIVEVTVKFRREIDTTDFITDDDYDDVDDGDEPEITLEEAASRLQAKYEEGDEMLSEEPRIDDSEVEVRVIGGR